MPIRKLGFLLGSACVITILLLSLNPATFPVAYANSTTYYVNNQSGSNCNDAGAGTTQSAPWCDFTPINSHTFGPGDQILLARGASWNQQMTINGSGAAGSYATIDAYGSGAQPKIIRNGNEADRAIRMNDPSYWSVNNLEIGSAGTGILVYYDTLAHQGLQFSNIYVHDIRGIHQGNTTSGQNDRIWNSAGIEITGNVSFTSTQYALQNVTLSNIEGTHNQDSISFDWFNGLTSSDGGDGHNLVQNVTMSSLYLHDDNGPAAGCDEGMRLVNMQSVTIFNSRLNDEGACHSNSGTAGIIFGRLQNVSFVNSIMTNVPNTSSPDQTGFDYECCNDQVRIRDSYIAGNAGAGIEFLAIHGSSDHSTNSEVAGNVFSNNGNGGIERLGTDITPTGTIRDNLYSEPAGLTTTSGGANFSGFTLTNNIQATVSSALYNAGNDYSGTQGQHGWSYQYSNDGASWSNLPYDASSSTWKPTAASVPQITQFGMHPDACSQCWVGRAWTAPSNGTISIRSRVLKGDISGGNGVVARITKNGSVIWGPQTIAYNDQVGIEANLDNVAVNTNDVVRFEIANNGDNTYDTTSWDPSIGYTASGTPALNRYYNGSIPDHWITSGAVAGGYHLETTLGYLYASSRSGTVALYGCLNGSDHFVSLDAACEGKSVLRTEGWIDSASATGTTQIYRCRSGNDHFVSIDASCEGQTYEESLGYVLNAPQ
ncbi:hypothetical protein [Dictyobacter kobayashii]|uniref:Right handed beta helix domain-containing protein n=1 Tax=Dictyobacter kobayashii TaxID=2014872 RepID=A0A402ARZ3_9CHLR|nr:hypothetical protein [Dictyobacter kobayashii]GCE21871.1 hypothetical protein KDK_56710 [Dictyobacter kobayashii]